MNLSKALKEKNKKAKKLSEKISKVISNNSYLETNTPAYNSKNLLGEVRADLDEFVKFKTALFNSTVPIRSKIFEIGELGSLIKSIKGMSTNESLYNHYAGENEKQLRYIASITELEKATIVEELETRVEQLQDEIDAFNAKTKLKEIQ